MTGKISPGGNYPRMKTGSIKSEPADIRLSDIAEAGYCLRRAALIINDGAWVDNQYTVEGSAQHTRTHSQLVERTCDGIIYHEFAVESSQYRIHGLCDAVRFEYNSEGTVVPFIDRPVTIVPVEYKHGRIRDELSYSLQLCGQALCLEEMFQIAIPYGMLYFANSHRNKQIPLTDDLREKTISLVAQLQKVYANPFILPDIKYEYTHKCHGCSFIDICSPQYPTHVKEYCRAIWAD